MYGGLLSRSLFEAKWQCFCFVPYLRRQQLVTRILIFSAVILYYLWNRHKSYGHIQSLTVPYNLIIGGENPWRCCSRDGRDCAHALSLWIQPKWWVIYVSQSRIPSTIQGLSRYFYGTIPYFYRASKNSVHKPTDSLSNMIFQITQLSTFTFSLSFLIPTGTKLVKI